MVDGVLPSERIRTAVQRYQQRVAAIQRRHIPPVDYSEWPRERLEQWLHELAAGLQKATELLEVQADLSREIVELLT